MKPMENAIRNCKEKWIFSAGYVMIGTKMRKGNDMEDIKIQWHPGFVAAMGLELMQDRDRLIFQKEYNLNTKPLEVDLLVIRKDASQEISNEIGRSII